MTHIISLENISRNYVTKGEKICALKNINLTVDKGEFVAIVGQSGSGKSTLMNILGCLDVPSKGKYYLDGMELTSFNEKKLAFVRSRIIGFIFQSFNLIPTLNAVENVELPLLYRKIPKSKRLYAAEKALDTVGLSARKQHLPSELSGGQQQRVAIARAIAAEPEILLADEPTGSLDKKSGSDVLSIIRDMNKNGVTIIMITHDESVADMAQRKIRISDGEIISQCAPSCSAY